MIHQIVPDPSHVAPSMLLGNRHAATAAAALTPDAGPPRPNLDDIGTAATAMAWAMQGRLRMARTTLRHLTPPMLWEVAVAAELLKGAAEAMIARGWDAPTEPLPVLPSDVETYPIGGATR